MQKVDISWVIYFFKRLKIRQIALLMLFPIVLYAQGMIEYKGIVKDAGTGNPLESAVVDIQYGGFSNGINEEGDFVFKIPRIMLDSAILTVSTIGYKRISRPVKELSVSEANVFLLEQADPIEVTLGISDAKVVVQMAVDSMKANNYLTAQLQHGYYREYAIIEDIGMVKLKESILRVERFPSDKKRPDRFKAVESRQLDWPNQSKKISAWFFENGPSVMFRALETGLPDFMTSSEMKKYEFRVDSLLVPYDTLGLYKIRFEPKSSSLKGGRTGYIYIEPLSRAIVRIEYNFTEKAIRELLSIGISNVKLSSDNISFESQYRKSGDKWVLAENRMKADILYEERLDNQFSAMVHWDFRFVATESAPLRRGGVGELDQLQTTADFKRGFGLSPEIWKNMNYIPSTEVMRALPGNLRK
jgi:hypothetical protein